MLKKIKSTIESHSLLRKKGKVVVALSGGADSVALLSALLELGYDCVAAHCNFHLRGEESNRDMRFAESLTEHLGVDLYVKEFNVRARMRETGESVEMACRELRYKWFFDLLDRDSAQAIAVGHHREDQAETFFLNLLRGTGLAGLAGMRYRTDHVVRPMLDVSRAEIEKYLKKKGLKWIEDSSNLSDEYARNRLRNRVLPLVEEQFAGGLDSVLRTMAILRENEEVYSHLLRRAIEPYVDSATGDIDLTAMAQGEKYAAAILFEYLKGEGFNRTQTDDMLSAALRWGGTFRAAGSTHVRDVDHGFLRAAHAGAPAEADEWELVMTRDIFQPVHIEITRHNVAEFVPEKNPNVAYIDAEALEGAHSWKLRHWRRGDRLSPYGMKGTKLVSDIFAEAKMSSAQKSGAWLLTRDNDIIWVVGLRSSSHFTVGPSTRWFVRLELKEK